PARVLIQRWQAVELCSRDRYEYEFLVYQTSTNLRRARNNALIKRAFATVHVHSHNRLTLCLLVYSPTAHIIVSPIFPEKLYHTFALDLLLNVVAVVDLCCRQTWKSSAVTHLIKSSLNGIYVS